MIDIQCRVKINAGLHDKIFISAIDQDRDWSMRVASLDLIFSLHRQGVCFGIDDMIGLNSKLSDELKPLVEQMMPEIGSNLRDKENKNNRMAGLRLLSVPELKGKYLTLFLT